MTDPIAPGVAHSPGGALAPGPADSSLITYTHMIYALHSLAILIGLGTAWTVVGSFLLGVPSIVAVIMNYARQKDARGTFLESHFRWQIHTFWYALLWAVIIGIVSLPLVLLFGLGLLTWWIGVAFLGVWLIYRVARGWLALRDGRPVVSL